MPEHPHFRFRRIGGRSIVGLRVSPDGARAAAAALSLPVPLKCSNGDPNVCWLGPDRWMFTSDTRNAVDIVSRIDAVLQDQLHAATDMSAGYAAIAVSGKAARRVLAMGCGVDLHESVFTAGRCVRTRFAQVPLVVVAMPDEYFDLYVDRSYSRYLHDWLAVAIGDPITLEF